jgi:hypothetical protein
MSSHQWRRDLFLRYDADCEANVQFPIRYFINTAGPWQRDITIEIPSKLEHFVFRHAIRDFFLATRSGEPIYNEERLSVRLRGPGNSEQDPDGSTQEQGGTTI